MLFKSGLVTQVSGSIGGMTGSHNRGGYYFRSRTIPTDPSSSRQQAMRAIMAQLVTRWSNVLTAAQRAAWNLYAANVPVINPLGDSINLSGQQWYIKANSIRQQAIDEAASAIALVDDGPTVFNLTDPGVLTISSASEATQVVTVAYNNAKEWAVQDGGVLLLYVGRPQNPGVTFFRGPWRLAGIVDGDTTTPPTSPATPTAPFAITETQNIWVRGVASAPDGRPSAEQILGPFPVAA